MGEGVSGEAMVPDCAAVEVHAAAFLAETLGLPPTPSYLRAHVLEGCIPQYTLGHGARAEEVDRLLPRLFGPSLHLAGNAWDGVVGPGTRE